MYYVSYSRGHSIGAEIDDRNSNRIVDYHKNMDSVMFMNWVRHILIPSFKEQHPGKKMILMLDNAPYHHCHVQGGINVKGATKRQLIDWAYELEMAHFTVTRDGNDYSM